MVLRKIISIVIPIVFFGAILFLLFGCNTDVSPTSPTIASTSPAGSVDELAVPYTPIYHDGNRTDGRLCHWSRRLLTFVQKEGLSRAKYEEHLATHPKDYQGYCEGNVPELSPVCHFNRIKDITYEWETRMVSEDQMQWHLTRHSSRTDPSLPDDYRGECDEDDDSSDDDDSSADSPS